MKKLGIDLGSLYLAAILWEEGREVLARHYREHGGEIEKAVRNLMEEDGFSAWDTVGITGSMAKTGTSVDPILATIEGAKMLLPTVRNFIAIQGRSFSLILLDNEGRYREHAANPPCAAGTGSFLEQQAQRLGLSVRELAERAAAFKGKAPRIAARCAVFAKTDITHAMQEGHTLNAVCAGLCEGVARSVLDMLLKGRKLVEPVGFLGGVSLNAKIASSMGSLLGIRIVTHEDSHLVAALGAAALGASRLGSKTSLDMDSLFRKDTARSDTRPPLSQELADYPSSSAFSFEEKDGIEILSRSESRATKGVFLGIDIGSTSTKTVLIDEDSELLSGFYTKTGGDPIAAVQALLHAMSVHFQGRLPRLLGVKTTGSGRKMIREVFRADSEVNEITAHAKAAVFLQPDVDTIIEIGGQDSKFTRVKDGDVYFSTMNYVCAAGTGSFIEEQAKRLGIGLAEFSDIALGGRAPFTSDRCTVYMERDLCAMIAEGRPREALAAAVLHSVRDNYLSKVVGKNPLGHTIVFQGATARNKALVSSFEQLLKKPIHVSPYCHLTGALGAALLSREEVLRKGGAVASRFLSDFGALCVVRKECKLCANRCRLTVVEREGGTPTAWGMKCGREYSDSAPRDRCHDPQHLAGKVGKRDRAAGAVTARCCVG